MGNVLINILPLNTFSSVPLPERICQAASGHSKYQRVKINHNHNFEIAKSSNQQLVLCGKTKESMGQVFIKDWVRIVDPNVKKITDCQENNG